MDSYRVEKHRMRRIILDDEDAEIDPVSTGEGGGKGEIETDRLSAIIEEFNDLFGGIEWGDRDRINRTVTVDIPAAVAKDAKFENARVESDKATERAVLGMVRDNTQLFNSSCSPTIRTSGGGWRTRRSGWPTKRRADESGRPAETLRGRFSAPLATTSSGPDTF